MPNIRLENVPLKQILKNTIATKELLTPPKI